MWSIDYVQVPDEDISTTPKSVEPKSPKPCNEVTKPTSIHPRLVKQIHVSNDASVNLMKSGSESSLSEENPRVSLDRYLYLLFSAKYLLRFMYGLIV